MLSSCISIIHRSECKQFALVHVFSHGTVDRHAFVVTSSAFKIARSWQRFHCSYCKESHLSVPPLLSGSGMKSVEPPLVPAR
jgi:hypothetical protein